MSCYFHKHNLSKTREKNKHEHRNSIKIDAEIETKHEYTRATIKSRGPTKNRHGNIPGKNWHEILAGHPKSSSIQKNSI